MTARPPADTSWLRTLTGQPPRPATVNARRARQLGWGVVAMIGGWGLAALLVWTVGGEVTRAIYRGAQVTLLGPGTVALIAYWQYWAGRRDQERETGEGDAPGREF